LFIVLHLGTGNSEEIVAACCNVSQVTQDISLQQPRGTYSSLFIWVSRTLPKISESDVGGDMRDLSTYTNICAI
jgi:hypothetical protein